MNKEEIRKKVGNKIRTRREELGLSQEQLATLIGYKTRGAVSKLENGDREISFKKMMEISKALQVDEKYFWVEQEPKKLNPKTEHWSNLYNNLSDELKAQADYMLNMTEAMFFNQEIKEEDMEEVKRSIMEAFYKARGL